MRSKQILETLDEQPVIYRRSADIERYVYLDKTHLSLYLYAYKEEVLKESEAVNLWHQGDSHMPWITPEAPVFTPAVYKNFTSFLGFWLQIYHNRAWNKNPPFLGEIVRSVHSYCYGGGYKLFLVREGFPLNLATPWEINMEDMTDEYGYDT